MKLQSVCIYYLYSTQNPTLEFCAFVSSFCVTISIILCLSAAKLAQLYHILFFLQYITFIQHLQDSHKNGTLFVLANDVIILSFHTHVSQGDQGEMACPPTPAVK